MKCNFIKPAKYEDTIVIKTQISTLKHVMVGSHYDAYHKQMGILIASGETNHGWTDNQLNPIGIEEKFPALYEALKHGHAI